MPMRSLQQIHLVHRGRLQRQIRMLVQQLVWRAAIHTLLLLLGATHMHLLHPQAIRMHLLPAISMHQPQPRPTHMRPIQTMRLLRRLPPRTRMARLRRRPIRMALQHQQIVLTVRLQRTIRMDKMAEFLNKQMPLQHQPIVILMGKTAEPRNSSRMLLLRHPAIRTVLQPRNSNKTHLLLHHRKTRFRPILTLLPALIRKPMANK